MMCIVHSVFRMSLCTRHLISFYNDHMKKQGRSHSYFTVQEPGLEMGNDLPKDLLVDYGEPDLTQFPGSKAGALSRSPQ